MNDWMRLGSTVRVMFLAWYIPVYLTCHSRFKFCLIAGAGQFKTASHITFT